MSNERHVRLAKPGGFLDVAPDRVVEARSPTDSWSEVMRKVQEHIDCGVRRVGVVDPAARTAHSFRSPTDVRRFGEGDDLPGVQFRHYLPGDVAASPDLKGSSSHHLWASARGRVKVQGRFVTNRDFLCVSIVLLTL
ncbi:MAG: Uma2 family endonuclease [Thermoanaerobaculia bacterium]